jgi:hypothetical protein
MYYDDIYHPNNSDDDSISNTDYTVGSHLSVSANKRIRNEMEEAKKADKGYYYYKKYVNNRLTKIEMYDSGLMLGSRIRDPITGSRLNVRLGSKDELSFFKVRWCGTGRASPVTLYYDCPEHFERHHKTTLSTDIKEKWHREHRMVDVSVPTMMDSETAIVPGVFEPVKVTVVH